MRNALTIFRREIRSYFVSPVAYVLLVAFLGLSGWYFYNLLSRFLLLAASATEQAIQLEQPPPIVNINMGVMRPWFSIAAELLLFLAPIVTMKLLAEERGTGRLDLLVSAPLTDLQLIMGKYLAGLALALLFIGGTIVYPLLLFHYGNPEPGQILAGYMGLVLLAAALIALGTLISSLTGNQVIAAAGSFGVIVLLWVIGIVASGEGTAWGAVLSYLSMVEHFGDFANGVIESQHVVFYFSFVLFSLFLTLRAIESQRWRG